ncbi:MAG: hypothetical protein DLM67_18430 [Candidatus Nephthysia bennettiae]|nr:MAG: hypothetical protein DLM67_18430 [Candidatus Dormibacteraeota bacterium]
MTTLSISHQVSGADCRLVATMAPPHLRRGRPCRRPRPPGRQPPRLIVIHLATQQLIAYENGCPLFLVAE